MKLFQFQRAQIPLLISNPHGGTILPPEIAARMTEEGRALPDTDWFLNRLYDWSDDASAADLDGAGKITGNISRYVVDLNRGSDNQHLYPGQNSTGLCPVQTFAGQPLYLDGQQPTPEEIATRIEHYWQPYHDQLQSELDRLINKFGHVVLLDAHSIASRVPRLFEGQLPDFNIGTQHGKTCSDALQQKIRGFLDGLENTEYSQVDNGRFVGGYITRHYGQQKKVEAVQLELSQRTYLDEANQAWAESKAAAVQKSLQDFVRALIA